jgi:hypothetical protein
MSNQQAGFLPPNHTPAPILDRAHKLDARREVDPEDADDSGLLAAADREHLAREIAAIERAAEALRHADPELETWHDVPAATTQKPRPIWLLIGVLWLSTALVTLGAVFAISALLG